jgi:hypothetical protein
VRVVINDGTAAPLETLLECRAENNTASRGSLVLDLTAAGSTAPDARIAGQSAVRESSIPERGPYARGSPPVDESLVVAATRIVRE